MSILTQKQTHVNTVEFLTYDPATDWHSCPDCGKVLDEGQDCPICSSDTILFASFARNDGEVIVWESCPDCGRIVDVGESCPDCDIPFRGEPVYADGGSWGGGPDYGLEARG